MISLLIAKSAVMTLHRDWAKIMMHTLGIFAALSDVDSSTWIALPEALCVEIDQCSDHVPSTLLLSILYWNWNWNNH